MRIVIGLAALLCLLGAALAQSPVCAGPYRTVNATPHYQPGNDYHEPTHRRRVIVDIATVAQINPAYLSAYNPDGYDAATQADILAALRQLNTRLDAQDKANLAALISKASAPAVLSPPVAPPVATPTPPATPPGATSPARPASGPAAPP